MSLCGALLLFGATPAHASPSYDAPSPMPPCRSNCRARLQQHSSRRRKVAALSQQLRLDSHVQHEHGLSSPPLLPLPTGRLPPRPPLGEGAPPPLPGLSLPLPPLPQPAAPTAPASEPGASHAAAGSRTGQSVCQAPRPGELAVFLATVCAHSLLICTRRTHIQLAAGMAGHRGVSDFPSLPLACRQQAGLGCDAGRQQHGWGASAGAAASAQGALCVQMQRALACSLAGVAARQCCCPTCLPCLPHVGACAAVGSRGCCTIPAAGQHGTACPCHCPARAAAAGVGPPCWAGALAASPCCGRPPSSAAAHGCLPPAGGKH